MMGSDVSYPKPTAQVEAYVEALGYPLAVRFLLNFGGTELHVADEPRSRSRLVQLVGHEKARALAERNHLLSRRVPLASRWLSQCLYAEGYTKADIARMVRVSDVTVRKYLPPPASVKRGDRK